MRNTDSMNAIEQGLRVYGIRYAASGFVLSQFHLIGIKLELKRRNETALSETPAKGVWRWFRTESLSRSILKLCSAIYVWTDDRCIVYRCFVLQY